MTQTVQAYTVKSAADELGVSTTLVYGWLKDGTLKRVLPLGNGPVGRGTPTLIEADSVLDLKAARTPGEVQ